MSDANIRGSHYENRQRAIELQNSPAHAHRAAEQQHQKQDRLSAHEQSRRALEHPEESHRGSQTPTTGHGVTAFGHDEIAAVAYSLWESRGCPNGSPEEDWFHAVKALRARATGESAGLLHI